jgi:predicted ribosome quality control (RQC) complex YloA/Tae2 family protein
MFFGKQDTIMALDGILLNRLTMQLKTALPLRINKIYQVSQTEIIFQCFNLKKYNLIISCHSVYNRLQFSDMPYSTPEEPSHFVMLLRKHIEGGLIKQIEQIGYDRIVHLTVETRNDLGDLTTHTIAVELMGKYANVILLEEDRILDALKRIPPFENTKRTIQPGAIYKLPDAGDKEDPFQSDTEDAHLDFSKSYHGISPILSAEIQYRMQNGQTFKDIFKEIQSSNQLFVIDHHLFHCIPLTHKQLPFVSYPLMQGLDEVYYQSEQKERIKQQTGDSFKLVNRELKKFRAKLPKLYHALDEALDCEKWREMGDYLYTYPQQVSKGAKEVTFERFDGEGMITIPLDPKLDVKANAKKLFQKYQKGHSGQPHIQNQIDLCQEEITYFEALQQQLEIADVQDAKEIRQELAKRGYMPAVVSKIRRQKETKPNYLTIKFNDHTTIYVGKNNLQNDFLTFKLGRKDDWWFHAKDTHGAHVIVQTDNFDEEVIRASAHLAAYYSKARHSSSVPVNYTQVKNIKKIPKSVAGLVRISNYKTIFIDPDASLIQSWLQRK